MCQNVPLNAFPLQLLMLVQGYKLKLNIFNPYLSGNTCDWTQLVSWGECPTAREGAGIPI